jgi:hypothetical protein
MRQPVAMSAKPRTTRWKAYQASSPTQHIADRCDKRQQGERRLRLAGVRRNLVENAKVGKGLADVADRRVRFGQRVEGGPERFRKLRPAVPAIDDGQFRHLHVEAGLLASGAQTGWALQLASSVLTSSAASVPVQPRLISALFAKKRTITAASRIAGSRAFTTSTRPFRRFPGLVRPFRPCAICLESARMPG